MPFFQQNQRTKGSVLHKKRKLIKINGIQIWAYLGTLCYILKMLNNFVFNEHFEHVKHLHSDSSTFQVIFCSHHTMFVLLNCLLNMLIKQLNSETEQYLSKCCSCLCLSKCFHCLNKLRLKFVLWGLTISLSCLVFNCTSSLLVQFCLHV